MTTPSSQVIPQMLLLPAILLVIFAAAAEQQQHPVPRPVCRDKCGDISIPFPFVIGNGCFRDGFEVFCNDSFIPPRAFLADNRTINLERSFYDDRGYYQSSPPLELYPCSYAMLVEKSWYSFFTPDMYGNKTLHERLLRGVPLVLDFAAGNASCPAEGQPPPPDYACISQNSSCADATITPGYACRCSDNYTGNPYIAHGCQDIDECKLPENPCSNGGICKNRPGGYDCPCKFGMKADGQGGACTHIFPPAAMATVGFPAMRF